MHPETLERFWAKVNKNGSLPEKKHHLGPCWLWTGSRISSGYGNFAYTYDGHRRWVLAHRLVLEMAGVTLTPEVQVDHLCYVRNCVRPDHLEPVSQAENVRREVANGRKPPRRKPACRNGHDFTPENTRVDRDGWRTCLTCKQEAGLRYRTRLGPARAARRRELRRQGRNA
ncbi:MAG: HNH endonuclease [Micromonospora sp.]